MRGGTRDESDDIVEMAEVLRDNEVGGVSSWVSGDDTGLVGGCSIADIIEKAISIQRKYRGNIEGSLDSLRGEQCYSLESQKLRTVHNKPGGRRPLLSQLNGLLHIDLDLEFSSTTLFHNCSTILMSL